MQPTHSRLLDRNIFQLDVLRGLAVLLVMCFHFLKGFSFGWVGVDLFFVLSGFLISGKLVESLGTPGYLGRFYLKRILRIVPLYYLVLIFFFVVIPQLAPGFVSASMQQLLRDQLYYWTFTVNFIEAKNGWPSNISLIHFWSLACEMQFYLIWPFVIMWIRRNPKRKQLLWALIALALIFRCYVADLLQLHPVASYVLIFSRIDAFALGTLAYFYISGSANASKKHPGILAISALILIILLCIIFKIDWHYSNIPVQRVGYTLNAIVWAGVLIWFYLSRYNTRFPMNILATCGKYSYAMYVFHLPIWIFLEKSFQSASKLWLIPAAFIITFLLALMSYHLYEKYFLRMKPAPWHA